MRSERFEQNLNVLLSEKPEDDLNREWELILQENPETGDYDMLILQIWAALLNQDWETGYQLASIAMKRNRLSLQANFLFAETAFQLGKYEESYDIYRNLFQLQELYKEEVLDMDELQSKLKEIGRYMLQDLSKDIPEKWACIFGDVIQAALDDKDLRNNIYSCVHHIPNYYGIHVYDRQVYYLGRYHNWYQSNFAKKDNWTSMLGKGEIYEILYKGRDFHLDVKEPVILPYVTNPDDSDTNFLLITGEKSGAHVLSDQGSRKYNYIRLDESICVQAEKDFVLAKPIPLKHHTGNKRLVLNIFIDSLNESYLEEFSLQELMPYTYEFFKKGVRCTNYYTGSEFTYPSIGSYQTGLRAQNHKLLNLNVKYGLQKDKLTLNEIFHDQGYVTAIIGGNDAVIPKFGYNRGTDRFLYGYTTQEFWAEDVVNETIEHIEAFGDSDLYLWANIVDLHDVVGGWSRSLATQVHYPWTANETDYSGDTTVYRSYSNRLRMIYREELKRIDSKLQVLFQYITDHYKDEDIIVTLFSDHGTSMNVPDDLPMMSPKRIQIPLLIRSDWQGEHECSEKIETIDFGHILCELAGIREERLNKNDGQLPVFFGGKEEKNIIFSQSLFPDRYYEAFMYVDNYYFYLKNSTLVTNECRVDLQDCQSFLTDEKGNEFKDAEKTKFCMDFIKAQLRDYIV